jgi:catalase
MVNPSPAPPSKPPIGQLAVIVGAVSVVAIAFAFTAGWLSPERLTPTKLVAALAPPSGPALGHRRNHVKGICFTGTFESNGRGAELSRAQIFAKGSFPALGRFNLGTPELNAPDATVRVRGMGLQLTTPGGQYWRTAMIDLPFFPVSTPDGFYTLLRLSGNDAAAKAAFAAKHPEFTKFMQWAGSAPWTKSYAEEPYNSLNSFVFANSDGRETTVRWSLKPAAAIVPMTNAELAKLGPNDLEQEIVQRINAAPQKWTLRVTMAQPEDPTDDPSKAWPDDRRSIDVGDLIVTRTEQERDGPCRDINFDPTVLPDGMRVSDDPFPAARSSAYARSYDLRSAETKYYPYHLPANASEKQ